MRATFTESLVHETLFNHNSLWEQCPGAMKHIIMHNSLENVNLESTEILETSFFMFLSSDSCHKKMLLESLNIPLKAYSAISRKGCFQKYLSGNFYIYL